MAYATIGRGKLWIAAWTGGDMDVPPADETWEFVGNCSEVGYTVEETTIELPDYTEGLKTIEDETTIEVKYNGSFKTSTISQENLARFCRATISGTSVRALTALETRFGLKFIANNPKGSSPITHFLKAKLTPNGSFALIADEYSSMTFDFKGLKSAYAGHAANPYFIVEYSTTTTSTTTTTTT